MENNQEKRVFLPLLFAIVLIIGMFLGYKMSNSIYKQVHRKDTSHQLDDLIGLIEENYADSIDKSKLIRNGIEGILKELDPHTVYIPKEKLMMANEELEGSFLGIGVEFFMLRDTAFISYVLPDGPSAKSGLQHGDKLIEIDKKIIAGKNISDEEIINHIRGEKESSVLLKVKHQDNSVQTIKIQRDEIPFKSVIASYNITSNIGYIKIRMFSETTYEEFISSLEKLISQGAKKLIIDVRDNPGGYMEAVAQIADELIEGNHLLIKTKGKEGEDAYHSKHKGLFEKGDLAILANENSASASEILAGCIQDLDRGIVIGRRTFGKGLVQEQFELPDHSAIRITTARYYLPSGRCIQKSFAEGKDIYDEELYNRYKHGELTQKDTLNPKKRKTFYTKMKRAVYENEGIEPDLFVGIDTTTNYLIDKVKSNYLIEEFACQYYFQHSNEFNELKETEVANALKFMTTTIKNSFINFCHEKRLDLPTDKVSIRKIELDLMAEFVKLKLGPQAKFAITNQEDEIVQKAIKLLSN